jgi:hypothetical protein
MGEVRTPPPVRFFASIMFNDSGILSQLETQLVDIMGPVVKRTGVVDFSQSDYYGPEMGKDLKRYFLLFEPLVGREQLAGRKLATNRLEQLHGRDGRRTVNIDPGYIALEQLVLATTKGFAHRIYVGDGIYADLTLVFENGTYRGLPWTYPDYGSNELIPVWNGWRERYKGLLRCRKV